MVNLALQKYRVRREDTRKNPERNGLVLFTCLPAFACWRCEPRKGAIGAKLVAASFHRTRHQQPADELKKRNRIKFFLIVVLGIGIYSFN